MKNIIDWLSGVEERAAALYEKASSSFPGDPGFSGFLKRLSEEERSHGELIRKAASVASEERVISPVTFDEGSRGKVEECFASAERMAGENGLTRDVILDFMVSTEFSEWNDLFSYVMNSMKRRRGEFIQAAVSVQRHKRHIARYLESVPELRERLEKIRLLPDAWEEKVLVVDDEPLISDVLAAILEDEGRVDSASNGLKALEMMEGRYYPVIVSDVDMPVVDGLEFYRRASSIYPGVKDRFIFFTGSFDEERTAFFRENGLRFLPKPFKITEIKRLVVEILSGKT